MLPPFSRFLTANATLGNGLDKEQPDSYMHSIHRKNIQKCSGPIADCLPQHQSNQAPFPWKGKRRVRRTGCYSSASPSWGIEQWSPYGDITQLLLLTCWLNKQVNRFVAAPLGKRTAVYRMPAPTYTRIYPSPQLFLCFTLWNKLWAVRILPTMMARFMSTWLGCSTQLFNQT